MKWIDESDEYELKSGRRFYANCGILGLGLNADLTDGYDGFVGGSESSASPFTTEERREIAEEMIRRWAVWGQGIGLDVLELG